MARSWADEELGDGGRPRPPPQRAPRPPSLLSFLRGGSAAGRRRWRRRERDGGGPLGAEQRMWLMGSDDEDEDDEEGADLHSPTFAESPTGVPGDLSPEVPANSIAASQEILLPAAPASTAGDAGDPPEASDPSKGWTVLLWRRGGGGEGPGGGGVVGGAEDGGAGGGRGGPGWGRRVLGGVRLVGCGLSGPWALGVFAVTGQVAGEVSGPCAVGSLALAAVAAVLAALCHAELEDVPAQGPRDYAPHAPPTSSSSSSISSHSDSTQSEDEGTHAATRGPPGNQGPPGGLGPSPPPPRRRPTTARALFCGWASLLGHAAALAAACRALSASMDYITGGRVRKASEEKLGALPDLLGHSSPDVLAVGVAALPTVLFVLGLEPWHGLRTMLNLVVLCSVAFFVGAGAFEADPTNWAHGFLPAGLSGLVSGSAMSTLAFVGLHSVVAEGRRQRALNIARTSAASKGGRSSARGQHQPGGHRHATGGIFSNSTSVALASLTSLALAFASYFAVATTLTMMVQFRSLSAGTPLVQAFEVRDVDWARLVMAALGIAALALALVEASPPLHRATVSLSAPDGLLPRRLAKEHPRTATPALAILASGLLAAALAFLATPLALLRLASAAPLLAHSLAAVDVIRRRYHPPPPPPPPPPADGRPGNLGDEDRDGRNRRRATCRSHGVPQEDRARATVRTLKEGLAFLRKEAGGGAGGQGDYQSLPTSEEAAAREGRDDGGPSPPGPPPLDEEPLLSSSAQDSDPIEAGCMASSSEDGGGPAEGKGGGGGGVAAEGCESGLSGYESDSNTDIDAIVAEYKERLKVATLDGGGKAGESASGEGGAAAEPSAATGRRVSMALCGLLACSVGAGGSVLLLSSGAGASAVALSAASSFVAFLLLALVARQPQGRGRSHTPLGSFRMPLVPWLPGLSLCLHVGLLLQVLVAAWMPFVAWTLAGCCLYYWKRGRRRKQTPPAPPGWGPRSRSRDQQPHHYVPHRRPREQVRLRPPPRHSVVSSLIPSHRRAPDESIRRLTQVDTILITR